MTFFFLVARSNFPSLLWFLPGKDSLQQDWFPTGLLLAKLYGNRLSVMLKDKAAETTGRAVWIAAATRLGPLLMPGMWLVGPQSRLLKWQIVHLAPLTTWLSAQNRGHCNLCHTRGKAGASLPMMLKWQSKARRMWNSAEEQRLNTYPSVLVPSAHLATLYLHLLISIKVSSLSQLPLGRVIVQLQWTEISEICWGGTE